MPTFERKILAALMVLAATFLTVTLYLYSQNRVELKVVSPESLSGDDGAIHSPDRRAAIKRSQPGDDGAIHSPDRRAAIKRSQP